MPPRRKCLAPNAFSRSAGWPRRSSASTAIPPNPETAELLEWLDSQTKRNLVITFGGGVNEVMREMIAASGLKVPRVPR